MRRMFRYMLTTVLLAALAAFCNVEVGIAKRARAPHVFPPVDNSPCGVLHREIRAEFEAFLSTHRDCTVNADCALARTLSPLACGRVAVAAVAVGEAEELSVGLLLRAKQADCPGGCKCAVPSSAACQKGQCSGVWRR